MKAFLEQYSKGIRIGFVALATILALGASGFKFHETYATNKRVEEKSQECLEHVAGNSQQIQQIFKIQKQNALMQQHKLIQQQIFDIETYWRGKQMPAHEVRRLQDLRIQLRQIELQISG